MQFSDIDKEKRMNLVIHDYNESEWRSIASEYEGWEKVACNDCVNPCVGCFGCWLKNPGECMIKDGYERMGELFHKAGEVVIISRYTYGGFSSPVKNIMDRSIGYILPFFEIRNNEMHHRRRYPEVKPITVTFRGEGFTDEEKARSRQYVEAVCTNFCGRLKEIRYEECEDTSAKEISTAPSQDGNADKIIFLNCSMRGENANSKKFLDHLVGTVGEGTYNINLSEYRNRYDELVDSLESARTLVLGMPLYVDGIPSEPLRIMEMMEKRYSGSTRKIYVVSNMGFYESKQICNLLGMVKEWCDKCGFTYGGGLAIGAGEMMGQVLALGSKGPAKNVFEGLERLGEAVKVHKPIDDIYVDAHRFPRFLYMLAANSGMSKGAKANGLSKKEVMIQR